MGVPTVALGLGGTEGGRCDGSMKAAEGGRFAAAPINVEAGGPVSYTHLTLPTILLV